MSLLSQLKQFSMTRYSWGVLFVITVMLELTALFFQHVMGLTPCVMCIYERVAMLGMTGAALVGMIDPKNTVIRWGAIAIWAYTAFRGLQLALQHVGFQLHPSPFATCDIFPQFPTWAPLDKWIPAVFEAGGDCSKIVWTFLSYSMPQWLIVVFAVNLIIIPFIVIAQFVRTSAK